MASSGKIPRATGGVSASKSALPLGYLISYTVGMKTAISLPDPVFHEAERYARRTKMNRSRLYAVALTEYLARHAPDEVSEAMNRVVDQLGQSPDSFRDLAARRTLERVAW